MKQVLPNDLIHHATMLNDRARIESYEKAILAEVKASDRVVEIGSGTGILSAIAARVSREQVTSIEYFKNTAECSRQVLNQNFASSINVINDSSYAVKLENSPSVLLTETIGAIGPEENIVELCYEFKHRHPSIEKILPATLSLFWQPVYSPQIAESKTLFLNSFQDCDRYGLNFKSHLPAMQKAFDSRFIAIDADRNTVEHDRPREIVEYILGESSNSDIDTVLDLNSYSQSNAVHVFFKANFANDHCLCSHMHEPWKHWKHNFIPINDCSKNLEIKYSLGRWDLSWEQ